MTNKKAINSSLIFPNFGLRKIMYFFLKLYLPKTKLVVYLPTLLADGNSEKAKQIKDHI